MVPDNRESGPDGASAMLAGVSSGVTPIWVVALKPLDDAVIVAVPTETPATTPAADTVATFDAELLHAMAAPGTVEPVLSRAVATSDSEAPTATVPALAVICTDDTMPAPEGGPDGPALPDPSEPPQAGRSPAAQAHSTAQRITNGGVTVSGRGEQQGGEWRCAPGHAKTPK